MKKILILGANEESSPIVKRARDLGIYTLVADYSPFSPAKSICDKPLDIDGKNVNELSKVIEKREVDGVLVGVADSLLPAYVRLCDITNKPCYLNKCSIEYLTEKKSFMDVVRYSGINIIPTHKLNENGINIIDDVSFPVIVKPNKSRGSIGVALCNNKEELIAQCKTIMNDFKYGGKAIVQEYINSPELFAYYYVENGSSYLISLCDSLVDRTYKGGCHPSVLYGWTYPSKYLEDYLVNFDGKCKKLIRNMKILNGIVTMQMFRRGKDYLPFDMEGNMTATLANKEWKKCFNIDIVKNMIEFSFTGHMPKVEYDKLLPTKFCAQFFVYLKPGKIMKIKGKDMFDNEEWVEDYSIRLDEGMSVTESMEGTTRAIYSRIWVAADSVAELYDQMKYVFTHLYVFDEYGNDMICRYNAF